MQRQWSVQLLIQLANQTFRRATPQTSATSFRGFKSSFQSASCPTYTSQPAAATYDHRLTLQVTEPLCVCSFQCCSRAFLSNITQFCSPQPSLFSPKTCQSFLSPRSAWTTIFMEIHSCILGTFCFTLLAEVSTRQLFLFRNLSFNLENSKSAFTSHLNFKDIWNENPATAGKSIVSSEQH